MTRSAEPARFHALPLRSVMPELSVMTTGYCAPAVLPAATMVGLPVIVMVSVSFVCASVLLVQVALVVQTMSATVFVWPPEQLAGPAWVAGPQSLSVSRIVAVDEMDIPQTVQPVSRNKMTNLSPWSTVFAKPPEAVSSARSDVGAVGS